MFGKGLDIAQERELKLVTALVEAMLEYRWPVEMNPKMAAEYKRLMNA